MTIRPEQAIEMHGVPARAFAVIPWPEGNARHSGRIANQTIKTEAREYMEGKTRCRIRAELRFDDNCKNGHETFAITADIDEARGGYWRNVAGGCCHEEIAKHFPELAPLIKWHLTSTDGPLHYVASVLYMAGDRDCWGLRKDETRQIRNGKTGQLCWKLEPIGDSPAPYVDADAPPAAPGFHYVAWNHVGEGKARELDHARSAAVWPEATEAELMQEPEQLKAALLARLPQLLADFKAAMLGAGFIWPEK